MDDKKHNNKLINRKATTTTETETEKWTQLSELPRLEVFRERRDEWMSSQPMPKTGSRGVICLNLLAEFADEMDDE